MEDVRAIEAIDGRNTRVDHGDVDAGAIGSVCPLTLASDVGDELEKRHGVRDSLVTQQLDHRQRHRIVGLVSGTVLAGRDGQAAGDGHRSNGKDADASVGVHDHVLPRVASPVWSGERVATIATATDDRRAI